MLKQKKNDCFACVWLVLIICVLIIGCSRVVESVDYYNACLNDPVCSQELNSVRGNVSSAVGSTVSATGADYTVAQLVGGLAGTVIAFFVGVKRGKQIQKG